MTWQTSLPVGCADANEQREAWAEIVRLRAIVDRIPKDAFTVDGLPCFGDEVVYATGGEPLVVDNFWGTPTAGHNGPTSEEDIVLRVDECFASVEAAKAAEVMDDRHSC